MADSINIDYYLACGDSDVPHFWDVFTEKHFRHCCAFKWDGYNWILIDPLGQCLDITIMPYSSDDDVPDIMRKAGFTVIRYKAKTKHKFIFRGILTCVTVCKQLMGIKAAWVVTPRQLHNYIKRSNTL
jgi:hypothetical protein|tara:strand:- start:156 stop:539 length:384 start_codon:yes stop_codon:yes gene_type:complete